MSPLEKRIRYKFRNTLLLAEALTHPSLSYETQKQHFDNQRLEFLGDSVLQLVITEHLYKVFPDFSEGRLTKLRARIVSRDGLMSIAQHIGLGEFILMGRGEAANGGRQRNSILADALEALIGAIYLDSNIETAREILLREARPNIDAVARQPEEVNPKGQLQEILQALTPVSPAYRVLSETGPEHQKNFLIQVEWENLVLGQGEGGSKKIAEIQAAHDAIQRQVWLQWKAS